MSYTPIPEGTLNWDVPLNAALTSIELEAVAAQATANAALPLAGGAMTGDLNTSAHINAQNTSADVAGQVIFSKSSSPNTHAGTFFQADTTGTTNAALNVVSNNPGFSSFEVSGQELNRGTIKVAHVGNALGNDSSAAGLSIDLQTSGTAAQGIFVTGTTGATTGNLITLRNNSRDDFVVKATGAVGVRVPTGHVPSGAIEINQGDTATIGLAMTATSGGLDMVNLKDSAGNQRFQVNTSGNAIFRATTFSTSALQLGSTSVDLGGSAGSVISMKDATTAPTTNPTGGFICYSNAGKPSFRDAAGNVVSFTKPTVTGSRGGNVALASLLTGLASIGLIIDSSTA